MDEGSGIGNPCFLQSRKHIFLFRVLVTDTALCHYLRPCSVFSLYFFLLYASYSVGDPQEEKAQIDQTSPL